MILKQTCFLGPDYSLHKKDIRIEEGTITAIEDSLHGESGEEVIDCSAFRSV
jgi:dihydroorotase-like cyclic amidohydrolase